MMGFIMILLKRSSFPMLCTHNSEFFFVFYFVLAIFSCENMFVSLVKPPSVFEPILFVVGS
jgi:hypothetical protein